MVSWKSCGEKEGGGEFLYNNLERELHSDLENEAYFMQSTRKDKCLEHKKTSIESSIFY